MLTAAEISPFSLMNVPTYPARNGARNPPFGGGNVQWNGTGFATTPTLRMGQRYADAVMMRCAIHSRRSSSKGHRIGRKAAAAPWLRDGGGGGEFFFLECLVIVLISAWTGTTDARAHLTKGVSAWGGHRRAQAGTGGRMSGQVGRSGNHNIVDILATGRFSLIPLPSHSRTR